MNLYDPHSVAFGRHETFPLRFGWLTKGYQALSENPDVFNNEDATIALGVGKNMVNAIKYWMLASRIACYDDNHKLKPTALGEAIFSANGWDAYLEDEATLWLVHWLLASNPNDATSLFWFFNRFHKTEFTSNELLFGLTEFVREHVEVKVATTTLKHDATMITRMYELSHDSTSIPLEEGLDSPLSALRLISKYDSRRHVSRPDVRSDLPLGVLAFAVAEIFETSKQSSIPIEQLIHSSGSIASPGSVFRLTEDSLLAKIEDIAVWLPGRMEIRETAGIHQLYLLKHIEPMDILKRHYSQYSLEGAA